MMSLESLGWTPRFAAAFETLQADGVTPARVVREDRGRYRVLDVAGERPAETARRLRHAARSRLELPAVGDWVAVRDGGGGPDVIVALLPRASAFVRRAAGEKTEEQIVAANIDTVFVVMGLDDNFNVRRVERYLTAAWESGATPVVVLNKSDLAEDLEGALAEVEAVAVRAAVVAVSALGSETLVVLQRWLEPGRTVALLGSSGVGKSTLVNALLGAERLETGAVREADSRGRHTTTHRELVALPGGALLIDTPGMRELQLWGDESSAGAAFPEIVALEAECRFGDCRHDTEPGCAVRAALSEGRLDEGRFESWRKLQRELRFLETKTNARARAEETAKWKAIHKSMKHHPKAKRWR
jgi:ribosome biogenesis GTPase